MQESLYKLRSDTKDAFEEAKSLEERWRAVEKSQKEVYQVSASDSVARIHSIAFVS